MISLLRMFWLMLPGLFADMAPVFARKTDFLDYPVDFKKKIKNNRLFGKNKTFRGFFFGMFSAILIAFLQYLAYGLEFIRDISIIDYNDFFLVGLLIGSGVLFGDLAKSFFKRRVGIKEGSPWIPFDQVDYAVGMLVFLLPLYSFSLFEAAIFIFLAGFLQIAARIFAFKTGIRKNKV